MTVTIAESASAACHELVALDGPCAAHCGAAVRAAGGRGLHFAPGRWLLVGWDAGQLEALGHQSRGKGEVFDVTGKYRLLKLGGPAAARRLQRAVDASVVLAGRPCAAVTLFDCPAILARAADGFEVWVRASYAAHLAASLRG